MFGHGLAGLGTGRKVQKGPLFGEEVGLPPFIVAGTWTPRRQQQIETVCEVWKELSALGSRTGSQGWAQGGKCKRGWARPRKGKKRCTPGFRRSTEVRVETERPGKGGARRWGGRDSVGSRSGRLNGPHTRAILFWHAGPEFPAGCLTDRKKTPVRH